MNTPPSDEREPDANASEELQPSTNPSKEPPMGTNPARPSEVYPLGTNPWQESQLGANPSELRESGTNPARPWQEREEERGERRPSVVHDLDTDPSEASDAVTVDTQVEGRAEPHVDANGVSDATKGAQLGGVGGLAVGVLAGAMAGPVGALVGGAIGAVVGAMGSGAAVAAVDRVDNDDSITGLGTVTDPLVVSRPEALRGKPDPRVVGQELDDENPGGRGESR